MINNLLILMAIIFSTLHYFVIRKACSKEKAVDLFLVYFLFFTVGLIGLLGFVSHVFFPVQTAGMIGWPDSPFQLEVGFHDGAWGLLGILAIWIRGKFWLAIVLGWSFFMLGATYVHIMEMLIYGNFAPYNAGSILPDFLVPIFLLFLCYLKYHRFARHREEG